MKSLYKIFLYIQLIIFTTACIDSPPIVKTISASLIADNSIEVKARILNTGSKNVYSFGFCISEDSLPTQSDTFYDCITPTIDVNAEFAHTFTNLKVNTYYHIRAYATNAEGVSYGENIKIKTLAKAIVTTHAATNITCTEATLNAFIDPLNSTTENWFEYWSEGESIKRTKTNYTSGFVSSNITGLTPNKVYQVIAKAKNECGESVSETTTFETYAVTDFDGNYYHTVTIGTQTWLRENFKGTHFLNGDPIANITDQAQWEAATSPAYCYYDNDIKYADTYGALYNWYVAIDSRGLINGYHVSTEPEWRSLVTYLGGSSIAGGKLKESGFSHWKNPNSGANNSTNFTALPGGIRTYHFTNNQETAYFWSSSVYPVTSAAYAFTVGYNYQNIDTGGQNINRGQTIRLMH